jgi:16S rRNA (guanine(966)-N(2))-methyltransferase RsmD
MKPPKKQKTLRPTANKVREALFDILRGKIDGARFLDLYAGTGAVGFDALKEGAEEVFFVEENRGSAKKIFERINKNNVSDKATVMTRKVLSFIEWADLKGMAFDIVFLDPPYHTDEILNALSAVGGSSLLKKTGIVIAEHFAKRDMPDRFGKFQKTKDYNYGDSVLSFYEVPD